MKTVFNIAIVVCLAFGGGAYVQNAVYLNNGNVVRGEVVQNYNGIVKIK